MAGEIEEPFRFDFQADLLNSGSISFGRFESESLSWERRSSFSHNRYLEEVEKYSKPGSVTEKKAYFEAHFRRKALLKQSSSESQDGKESPTSEHNDLNDLQESENCNESKQFTFFNESHDEETKIQKSVNKNVETLCGNETVNDRVIMVDVASEANNLSLTSHTADKDNDMVIVVKPTSEPKQSKLKARANASQVQRIISSEASVKAKTRESKGQHMKEKEKKAPRPATPIAHSGRKTFKSEESSRSFSNAKILSLNKSIVKEYKSVKTTETKSLVLEKSLLPAERQTGNRNKQTTTTPSVNKGSTGFTFRSDQRAERRKEEKRAAEMAQSQQSHNFKATPMPSFYKESTRSAQQTQYIRPSSSPSLTNRIPPAKTYVHEKKKNELTFQPKEPKPTKGPRILRKDIKRVDLVNGPKHGYLAVGVAK